MLFNRPGCTDGDLRDFLFSQIVSDIPDFLPFLHWGRYALGNIIKNPYFFFCTFQKTDLLFFYFQRNCYFLIQPAVFQLCLVNGLKYIFFMIIFQSIIHQFDQYFHDCASICEKSDLLIKIIIDNQLFDQYFHDCQ